MSSVRFDPNLSLCKANILQFKGLDPLSLSMSEFWFHAEMAIKYAVRCMDVEGNVREVIELLDEVDSTGNALTYHYTNPTFIDRPGSLGEDDHWATFFLPSVSHPNFSHLMVACGVHQYLTRRLRKEDVRNERLTGEPTPLLITAVQQFAILSNCDELAGPHVRVVEALMKKGADCLQVYHGRSAFSLVQRARKVEKQKTVYEEISRVFERYSRRKLPMPVNLDSSMAVARHHSQYAHYQESDNDSIRSTDGLCEGQNGREEPGEGKRPSQDYRTVHIQGKNIKMREGNDRSELGVQHRASSNRSNYSHSLNSRGGETSRAGSRMGQLSTFNTPRSLLSWDQQQSSGSQLITQNQQNYPTSNPFSSDLVRTSQEATPRRRNYYISRFFNNPFSARQGNAY
uniref:Uncharacterized protein n=1 Tax=Bionectria ochroleuca TaxID=29856 RepID=A0A8H7N627_BIOOC